jgi:phosphopantothenoylcysteine decarboxylase/phosphopantothenate--cysteine ligase
MRKKILILSGPTHEYIDPVRFIGNASSGRMGKAIAEEAQAHGYEVQFITGPVANENLPDIGSDGIVIHVTSAGEMLQQASALFPDSAVIIFAAAVADYAPQEKLSEKMAKSEADLVLKLRATPDIAATLCKNKRSNQTAIGFALQTTDGESNARRKLESKNLDGIVLNSPATLGASNGTFSFISATAEKFDEWGCIGKTDCARKIFEQLNRLIHGR